MNGSDSWHEKTRHLLPKSIIQMRGSGWQRLKLYQSNKGNLKIMVALYSIEDLIRQPFWISFTHNYELSVKCENIIKPTLLVTQSCSKTNGSRG